MPTRLSSHDITTICRLMWGGRFNAGSEDLANFLGINHRNALYVEIISGLQMGETIVLHPSNDIKDGVSIKPRTQ